jgi:phosphatidylglycerophosphatase A
MRLIARVIATVAFVGYAPIAPGTAGSLVGWLVGLVFASVSTAPFTPQAAALFVGVFVIGVVTSGVVERDSGQHDPSYVVIDEFVGMWVVLLACPFVFLDPWLSGAAFVLFRIFDVTKPPPLKWLSRRSGGWGIMLDDLGASGYTVLILWLTLLSRHLQPLG